MDNTQNTTRKISPPIKKLRIRLKSALVTYPITAITPKKMEVAPKTRIRSTMSYIKKYAEKTIPFKIA